MTVNSAIDFLLETSVDVYYHGASGKVIRAIAASGKLNPGVPEGEASRGYLKPMAGRVYLTKSLPYALMYSIGAAMVGKDISRMPGVLENPEGGLVTVSAKPDASLPDEDWVGEILCEYESHRRGRTIGEIDSDRERKIKLDEYLYSVVPNEIRDRLAKRESHKLYEYAVWAQFGKMVNRWLLKYNHSVLKQLQTQSPHLSFSEELHPQRAWVFDKVSVNPKIKPDGSNIFDLATEIPVTGAG